MDPPDLCTSSLLNVLHTIAADPQALANPPKLVVLSSTGLTPATKRVLPLLYRPLYGWLLHNAHADKRGLEALVYHGNGKEYEPGQTPDETILPANWKEGLPPAGWLKNGVIIRAALLTNGEPTGTYRAAVGDFTVWTIRRQDVGHFIAEELVKNWDEYGGNAVTIGY